LSQANALEQYAESRSVRIRDREFFVRGGILDSAWDAITSGGWEPDTFRVLDAILSPDTTYLDLGAWAGPTLLYAAAKAKDAHGFEPDPIAFAYLQANLALNPADTNIAIYPWAIGAHDGMARLGNRKLPGDSTSSLLLTDLGETWEVPCRRLDTFLRERAIQNPVCIKMDIEGGEYLVLPDMVDLLRSGQVKAILLALHPWVLLSDIKAWRITPRERIKRRWRYAVAHLRLLAALRPLPRWETPDGKTLPRWRCYLNAALGRPIAPGGALLARTAD